MNTIGPPDSHYVRAAEGWIELGNIAAAADELKMVAPRLHKHPDVLMIRWDIYAGIPNWLDAYAVAQALVAVAPQEAAGWINSSFALHRMNRTRDALNVLLPAIPMFPKDAAVAYNLACFSCQLGDVAAALQWLLKAIEVGEARKIVSAAMKDDDLLPIRNQLKALK